MPVTIGALRETVPGEMRVSVVPEVAEKLSLTGARLLLERGAGVSAQFPDALYKKTDWADSAAAVVAQADVLLTVQPLSLAQIGALKPGTVVGDFVQPQPRLADVPPLRE